MPENMVKLPQYLTDKMVMESKMLLSFLGVPTIQAPSEGEATAHIYPIQIRHIHVLAKIMIQFYLAQKDSLGILR